VKRLLVAVAAMAIASACIAEPDYERENRWAGQVVPYLVVGDSVYLEQKNGHRFLGLYTEAADARMGLVVVHGVGVHPDHGLIGTLRRRLPEHGYATLSVQMPVLGAEARGEAYAALFPDAAERLRIAVDYLRGRGYRHVGVVSHSLGTRMTHAYLIGNPASVSAWAALGAGTGPGPTLTYEGIRVPVLDLYGAKELPVVLAGAAARRASLPAGGDSRQVVIADADHFFAGREEDMVAAVRAFLDRLR